MHRPITVVVATASFLLAALGTGTGSGAVDPVARSGSLSVGQATLHHCTVEEHTVTAMCGSISVPLNYNSAKDGTITVGYAYLPATAETFAQAPTIVAEEGGPGYPATGSAGDYQQMLGTQYLKTHNLLVVDERGTGLSTLIDCEPLQRIPAVSTTPRFTHALRACGRSLDHMFRRQGGGFVHASDLFTTANSVRDMVRVLNVLGLDKVDLYGDSYGTYFSQSFMSHFPDRLKSVTLDSAYEARDLDPWYHSTLTTGRRAFNLACDRSAACHAADPGRSWNRISRLAALLREQPVSGSAPGVGNDLVNVHLTIQSLVNIVNDAGFDYDPVRQLDAAARAYLQHRDARPLLRLYAQDEGYDYGGSDTTPFYYSDGQYYAISCADYPQLFNMRDSTKKRRHEFRANVRNYPKHAFAPFTVKEWVSVNPFTEPYHACTDWPRRVHRSDPPVVPHQPLDASHVPVLILNGELDSLTPAAGGSHIHRQIGDADSRHIITANTVHLVAVDNPRPCGKQIVRRFLADTTALHSLGDACAPKVRAVRTVGTYPRTVGAAMPVHGPGSVLPRRLASVALAASGDAAHRFGFINGKRDLGLRGGTIEFRSARHGQTIAHLKAVRWTTDSTVSGHVTFSSDTTHAVGTVTVTGPNGTSLACGLGWSGSEADLSCQGHHAWHAPAP